MDINKTKLHYNSCVLTVSFLGVGGGSAPAQLPQARKSRGRVWFPTAAGIPLSPHGNFPKRPVLSGSKGLW